MVQAPISQSEACEQMSTTLDKLQSKLIISPLTTPADQFLNTIYPSIPKKVKSTVTEISTAKNVCEICEAKLSKGSKRAICKQSGDWEEETLVPSSILICCEKCYKVSIWSELFGIFMRESLASSSCDSLELTELVEHYLTVNGHKLADITKFNSAISLAVSLNTTMKKLNMTFPSKSKPIDKLISELVVS